MDIDERWSANVYFWWWHVMNLISVRPSVHSLFDKKIAIKCFAYTKYSFSICMVFRSPPAFEAQRNESSSWPEVSRGDVQGIFSPNSKVKVALWGHISNPESIFFVSTQYNIPLHDFCIKFGTNVYHNENMRTYPFILASFPMVVRRFLRSRVRIPSETIFFPVFHIEFPLRCASTG